MPAVAFLAALFLSGSVRPAAAQAVQGQLTDRATGEPIEGALVLLLTESGEEVGGYLTNEAGRFLLRAPGPGLFTVRAERIGFETVSSDTYRLSAGEPLQIHLETDPSAIRLEGIRVEGEQQCVVRPEDGLEVARVWEEARKALTVQEWTEEEGAYRFNLTRYERTLDPYSSVVTSETRSSSEAVNRNPIRSLPVEELLENGFIQRADDGGYFYYGPDATVLLSDPFLDNHCFRLTADPDLGELVGLSFESVRPGGTPDIEGTLWLDRETAKLRYLDYGYDWAPWPEVMGVARGRIDFQEMPNGAWIIRRWRIRMPEVGQHFAGRIQARSSVRLVGIREVGGEVGRISSMNRTVISEAAKGRIMGQAWDSLRGAPLAGATAFLSGTQFAGSTNEQGEFVMEDVPAGRYGAALSYPFLDSLGVFPPGAEVVVTPEEITQVNLSIPSMGSLLAAVCGGAERREGDAALTGIVRREGSRIPVAGAAVAVEWSLFSVPGGRDVREDVQGLQVQTDDRGRYRVCGIPPGVLVRVRATHGKEEIRSREPLEAPRSRVVALDLLLPPVGLTP